MKSLLRFALSGVLLALSLPAIALPHQSMTLKNGMEIILIPDARAPLTLSQWCVKAGSIDETEETGPPGMAHFLEHMLFRGTETMPDGAYAATIGKMGGSQNAFTYTDATCYYAFAATEHLPAILRMEADRMAHLRITDAVALPERDVVLEERKGRSVDDVGGAFYEKLRQLFEPYGHPIIGYDHHIATYNAAKATKWWENFYVPNNTTLILISNLSLESEVEGRPLKALLTDVFGGLRPREVVRPTQPVVPLANTGTRFVMRDARVAQPSLTMLMRAPGYFTGLAGNTATTADAPALSLLSGVLSTATGHLNQVLVVEKRVARYVDISYDGINRGEGRLTVSAAPVPGVSMETLEKELRTQLAVFLEGGINQDLLDRVRTGWRLSLLKERDSRNRLAYELSAWLMAGGTMEGFEARVGVINTLTPKQIAAVGKKYLLDRWEMATVGILTPEDSQ